MYLSCILFLNYMSNSHYHSFLLLLLLEWQTPLFMGVQNFVYGSKVVPMLLKEGARADIIDNVSIVIHVY